MALTGAKALTMWCKQMTDGYKDVEVRNMTSSWRDGLAFCAILHHYRPDLINFDKLSKENIAENNYLAFTVAEDELGIPALLDVEDMVQMEVPDKLSILTYVSQYYNYFKDKVPGEIPRTPKRHATKRQSPYKSEDSPKKRPTGDVPGISATKEVIGSTPDPNISKGTLDRFCANCGKTVYLMERMQVEGKIFHRVCFVCALCEIQLRMGTYRYIPTEEQFYCDRHYRQRTTSTSTDDSSRPKNGNQKNEQDALKNLLESLENKRKHATATQNEDDITVMKHASVHERIANARKRFSGVEQMETDYERQEEIKENVEKNSDSNDLTLGTPRHRPPRPMQLPGRPPDSTPKAEAAIASDVEIIETPNVQEIPKRPALPSILLSNDESKMKEAPVRPARPTSPPGHSSKQHRSPYENTTPKDLARGILSDVLMKAQNDSKSIEDKGGVHIYETPFANVSNEKGGTNKGGDVLFENPRYRESIKIETKPVYENTGAALLSLEDKRVQRLSKDIHCETESESNESDIDLEMRSKSHSTSSDDRKKKKLVLKVKKKKKTEAHEGKTSHVGNIEKQTGSDIVIVGKEDQTENEEAKKEDTDRMEEDLTADEKCPHDQSNDTKEENESKVEEIGDVKGGESSGTECMEDGEPTKEEGKAAYDDERREFEIVEAKPELPQTPELEKKTDDIQDAKCSGDEEQDSDNVAVSTDDSQKESFKDEEDSTQNENTNEDQLVESNIVERDGLQEPQPYESHGNGMLEPQPYASHGNGEKKRKVLKYVNPFDDSDEDEVSNKQLESQVRKKIVLNPFEDSSGTECDSKEDLCVDDLPPKEDELMDDVIGRAVSRKIKLVAGEGPKTAVTPEQMAEHQRRIENLKKGLGDNKEKSYKNPFEDSDDDLLDEPQEVKPKNQSEEHKHKKVLVLKVKKKKYKAPAPPVEQSTLAEPVEKDSKTVDNYEQDNATTKPSLVPADPLETFKTYVENSEIEVRKRIESRGGELYTQRQGQPGRPMSPLSVSCPALDRNDPQSVIDNDLSKTSSSGHLPEGMMKKECLKSDENQDGDTEKAVDRKNKDVKESGDESKEPMTVQKDKPPKRPAPPVPKGATPYKESPPMPHISAVANQNRKIDAGEATNVVVSKEKEINEGKGLEKDTKSKGQKPKEIEKQKGKNLKEGEKLKGKHVKESEKKEKKSEAKKREKDKKKKAKKGETNETEKNIEEKQEKEKEEDEEGLRLERTYTFIEDKPLTIDDIGQELKEIEAKQRVLEGKGVEMEKRLREQLHGDPEEDYMVTWFDLVTEKNRLLRRENELIYMSQEIDYHEYQKKIEYELRLLMEKDESTKTDEDRQAEEQLLQQLVNYVSRRNKIVEKIEKDRIREREEDEQIQMIMQAQGLRKQKKKKAGKKNSTGSVFYS